MAGFARNALFMFLALRAGDLVGLAAGMWFVPKYVSAADIGAVLPATSFATLLSLPAFALAMAVMKETAWLASAGERGRVKSLLKGVFLSTGAVLVLVLLASWLLMPRFLSAMRVGGRAVAFLVVVAAFLGCAAPVYTDALQALGKFRALAAVEVAGSVARFLTMLVAMPVRALAGYFAGQAALPAFRVVASVCALRRELSVPATPFWNGASVRRLARSFAAVLAYQALPLAASVVEQSAMRTCLSDADTGGFYMASRFSDFLGYLTFPLLLVMFPYTARAAQRGESVRPFVAKCCAASAAAALLLAAAYALFGRTLISLMPNGAEYAGWASYMPWLVACVAAPTSCQVFYTNAEVSAGRFGFLRWFAPLHVVYAFALAAAAKAGAVSTLGGFVACFAAASALRLAFSLRGIAFSR